MDDCFSIGNGSIYESMLLTIALNEGKTAFVERRKKRREPKAPSDRWLRTSVGVMLSAKHTQEMAATEFGSSAQIRFLTQ